MLFEIKTYKKTSKIIYFLLVFAKKVICMTILTQLLVNGVNESTLSCHCVCLSHLWDVCS